MFQENFKAKLEVYTTYTGITLFLIHLLAIMLLKWGIIPIGYLPENIFGHPFCALFSPFSILLIYEVYLLIYYLRKSYTRSVAKQIEIMALIVLRNNFKDIGNLIQGHSPLINSDLIKDLAGFIGLLILSTLFNKLADNRKQSRVELTQRFIQLKLRLSVLLFWLLLVISIYSFSFWLRDIVNYKSGTITLQNPSHIFYGEFFTILTMVDVILLLSSAKNLTNSMLVIRNSGYVLSTLLMRISFEFQGWERIITILLGASLAVFMLWIYNTTNPSKFSVETA